MSTPQTSPEPAAEVTGGPAAEPVVETKPETTMLTSTEGSGSAAPTDGGTGAAPTNTTQVTLPENWKDSLPDDIKTDPTMAHINNVENLAKSYIHAQKAIGADKIVMPDKNATEDDWHQFHLKMGLPQTLDSYQVEVPEGNLIDGSLMDVTKEAAWKSGILPNQFNKTLGAYTSAFRESQERVAKEEQVAIDGQMSKLKDEWGVAFESEMSKSQQGVQYINDPDFNAWLNESNMGNNPMFIRVFNKVGKLLAEDKVLNVASGGGGKTPNTARQEIANIQSNPKHPFNDGDHANHATAVQDVQRLYQMAYPPEEKS